ncbi:MAG: DUF3037 domain-containing protein [Deltaproteobacteria bacterium]|nr:DUF3037 domain-containing protein [Deltaproteobacteria bacterium]
MSVRHRFDYTIIRVVPRVDRGELVNVGVLLYCLERDFLAAGVALDERRLDALWPGIDLALVRRHVEAIVRIAAGEDDAGPIARLPQRERWHWLVAPRSTIVQLAPVHSGLTLDPQATLEHLVGCLVRLPG